MKGESDVFRGESWKVFLEGQWQMDGIRFGSTLFVAISFFGLVGGMFWGGVVCCVCCHVELYFCILCILMLKRLN